MKIVSKIAVLFLSLSSLASAEVIELGTRRELFVDHFLIDKMQDTTFKLHEPHRDGVALPLDKPWEGIFSAYPTVIQDSNIFRMYYRGKPAAGKDGSTNESVCYAESKDGITWTKPDLGLFNLYGTTNNNVVLTNSPYSHNFNPLLDTRPGVPATERYKGLAGYIKTGLHAFQSPDGIHWQPMRSEPVITEGVFDSQNVAFWSETEQQYVCYFRTYKKIGKENFRWTSRTTSKDFLTWTKPEEMDFGDTAPEHLYTNGTHPYYRAPHLYIGLAKRFFQNKVAVTDSQAKSLVEDPHYRVASSDSIFMSTRGGLHYDRTFMEAFIRPGPGLEDWIARDNAPALGVIPANPREMFIYRLSHYAQPSIHLARYTLRADGFISINAPYRGGELLTKPFTFAGSKLELNFQSSAAGAVRVEIQDEAGQPVAGYALTDCPEMLGDDVDRIVNWKTGPDVSKLVGKTIRLRFVMRDADLYSLKFF